MTAAAPPSTGLIVPIRVEAMPIGTPDGGAQQFLPPYAEADKLSSKAQPYLGSTITNTPFDGALALEAGIHLHWNLPRSLRRGSVEPGSTALEMPAVPDRWLITRIAFDPTGAAAPNLSSWVAESNYLAPTNAAGGTAVPVAPAGGGSAPYAYLGRVYPLGQAPAAAAGSSYTTPLTAMGFGIPDFASYYPNCRNVFGWQDTLTPAIPGFVAGTTQLAYVVTGWYSNPAQDPAATGDLAPTGNALGWDFTEGATPGFSLYHGVVAGLSYNPATGYLGSNAAEGIEAAFGTTAMEAFAALAAAGNSAMEDALNAFQLGELSQLGQPGGLAAMERALHDRTFIGSGGGTLWQIQPAQGSQGAVPAIPAAALTALTKLNADQAQLDAQTAELAALQSQLYMDWTQYMQLVAATAANLKSGLTLAPQQLGGFLGMSVDAIQTLNTTIGTTATTVAGDIQAVKAALAKTNLTLTASPAGNFQTPADPVLLLAGTGLPLPPPDETDALPCRLTSQVVDGLSLGAGIVSGSVATTLATSGLPSVSGTAYPAMAALVQEALLLLPAAAPWLARQLAAQGGSDNPATLGVTQCAQAIAADQTAISQGTAPAHSAWSGTLPFWAVEYRSWTLPWNPVALSWQVELSPVAMPVASGAATFVTANFAFDPGSLDLRLLPSAAVSSTFQTFSGTVLLSPDAGSLLTSRLEQCAAQNLGGNLGPLQQALASYPLLAQSLGGFYAGLVQGDQTMQLEVADPFRLTGTVTQGVANALALTPPTAAGAGAVSTPPPAATAPLPNNVYQPLLAGKMKFTQLWLTDQFGRYHTLPTTGVVVGSRIPLSGDQPPQMMPPLRLAQPSRLNLAWVPAQSAAAAPDNPICGWVVPNHLEQSLMLFDGGGAALGSLSAVTGGAPLWQSAPTAGTPPAGMTAALANCNPVLSAFAAAVLANGSGFITAMLTAIATSGLLVQPAGSTGGGSTAVLMGAPLALAQATVSMQLLGPPAADQGPKAFESDVAAYLKSFGKSNLPPPTRTNFAGTVQVPVQLGGLAQVDDGLIGFFAPNATGTAVDYNTFYSQGADGSEAGVAVPGGQTLTVGLPAGAPQTVTLLVDPRCAVHAYDGLHPVETLSIAPHVTAAALSAMSFAFLVAPVLSPAGVPAFPLPAESSGGWTWISAGAGGWTAQAPAPAVTAPTFQAPRQIQEGWLVLSQQGNAST